MAWEDFEAQIGTGRKLARAYADVGAAVVRRIGDYSRMYQDYQESMDVDSLMFLPMFHYNRQRNFDAVKRNKWFKDYCDNLYREAADYRKLKKEVYFAEFSVKYAFYLTKEDRKHG